MMKQETLCADRRAPTNSANLGRLVHPTRHANLRAILNVNRPPRHRWPKTDLPQQKLIRTA